MIAGEGSRTPTLQREPGPKPTYNVWYSLFSAVNKETYPTAPHGLPWLGVNFHRIFTGRGAVIVTAIGIRMFLQVQPLTDS
jgi:hypothetical protein